MLLLADLTNFYIHMALLCTVWLAAVGGVDDWLKLSAKKRGGTRDGLKMWEKLMFQLGLGVVLAYFIYLHGIHNAVPNEIAFFHKLYIPFLKGIEGAYTIPLGVFMVMAVLVIAGTSNAVNFTDGLDGSGQRLHRDGRASPSCWWRWRSAPATWAGYLLLPHVPNTDELSILCGAMVGACLGFLWYNCYPARIFMGDIGSVTLGGLIGYVAVVTRQEIMLVLVGADLRDGRHVRGAADRLVQTDRQADLPLRPDPPPFPDGRLEGDPGSHPLLAGLGHLRRGRSGQSETAVIFRHRHRHLPNPRQQQADRAWALTSSLQSGLPGSAGRPCRRCHRGPSHKPG